MEIDNTFHWRKKLPPITYMRSPCAGNWPNSNKGTGIAHFGERHTTIRTHFIVSMGGAMDMRCPVIVDGKPCNRKFVKQELEDQKLGPIEVYVCEEGHRPLFVPVEKLVQSPAE
jgi:hypothetical protein